MKHQKHTKLPLLTNPNYEISVLGSNCSIIKKLFFSIHSILKNSYTLAFIDADHKEDTEIKEQEFDKNLIDKIEYKQLTTKNELPSYLKNAFFNETDLIFVNGNHERASKQIVIIDPKKEVSLRKKEKELTNVLAFISLEDAKISLPAYIKELIPSYETVPLFSISEQQQVCDFIKQQIEANIPPIQGLILGGGKSTRMGKDKIFMDYHGTSQHQYLNTILNLFCEEVFVSCRKEQSELFENPIEDSFLNLGASAGILSAFQKKPNSAWFTVACDVPLLNEKTLENLFNKRNPSKIATCFYNSETKFPEPLITIWEPKAYPVLLHYLALGYSCPRKILINNNIEMVVLDNEDVLLNANTITEKEKALTILSNQKNKQ